MKSILKIKDPNNKLIIIGLLSIFIILWIIVYAIPGLLSSLFNTILGKLILVLLVLLLSIKNVTYGVLIFIFLIIIYRLIIISSLKLKEGFEWDQKSLNKFLEIQKTINPGIVFSASEVQKQASQKELEYFLKHYHWPWSKETEELYITSLNYNPYVRTDPQLALETIRTIYNENAILQLLSWQAKEGQFLRNGITIKGDKMNEKQALPNGWGDYAFDSRQIRETDNIIKCGINEKDKSLSLQKILFMGDGGILYEHVKKIIPLDYKDLEKIIPGFKFLKSPCNPCEALEESPNYNCPFSLKLKKTDYKEENKDDDEVSPIWKYLWFDKKSNLNK